MDGEEKDVEKEGKKEGKCMKPNIRWPNPIPGAPNTVITGSISPGYRTGAYGNFSSSLSIAPNPSVAFSAGGVEQISIDFEKGLVKLSPGMTVDSGARLFWQQVVKMCPIDIPKLKREMLDLEIDNKALRERLEKAKNWEADAKWNQPFNVLLEEFPSALLGNFPKQAAQFVVQEHRERMKEKDEQIEKLKEQLRKYENEK